MKLYIATLWHEDWDMKFLLAAKDDKGAEKQAEKIDPGEAPESFEFWVDAVDAPDGYKLVKA